MGSIGLRLTAVSNGAGRQLRATGERNGSAVLLCVSGSIDASNVAVWRRLLDQAAHATWAPGPVIVDVGQLEFMGCCGYVALAEESVRCRRRGIKLCLVSRQGIAARAVAATGLRADLPIYPSVGAVLDDEQRLPESRRHVAI